MKSGEGDFVDRHLETVKVVGFSSACLYIKGDEPVKKRVDEDLVGQLEYIAPEVLSEHEYSIKSDCWAIGVVAFTLLSG